MIHDSASPRALELLASCDAIDLHIESFLWTRIFGYDLTKRHGRGLLGARFYSQLDLPRAIASGMSGGVFSIVTNPLRRRSRRTGVFLRNLARLRAILRAADGVAEVSTHSDYLRARAEGKYAVWLAIQGGNALDSAPVDVERIPDNCVSRITLLHLSRSTLGSASAPMSGGGGGLTPAGREMVRRMNARRILVDLAHISQKGFWDALEEHDPALPPVVTHTGVQGVHPMWRNLTDEQLRAIAQRGGIVGIVFHSLYLDGSLLGTRAERIVDHMDHAIQVAGEDCVALGSDWDGLIVTPRDMPTILEFPVLVQRMLDRGWGEPRIRKVLGENYLRVLKSVRP